MVLDKTCNTLKNAYNDELQDLKSIFYANGFDEYIKDDFHHLKNLKWSNVDVDVYTFLYNRYKKSQLYFSDKLGLLKPLQKIRSNLAKNKCTLSDDFDEKERSHLQRSYNNGMIKKLNILISSNINDYNLMDEYLDTLPKKVIESLKNNVLIKSWEDNYPKKNLDVHNFDISYNNIKNLCDLSLVKAERILIENNPIEHITFANPNQFVNIIYNNDFDNTNLSTSLKSKIIACKKNLGTFVRNIDTIQIKEPIYLSDSVEGKKVLKHSIACSDVYHTLNNDKFCSK